MSTELLSCAYVGLDVHKETIAVAVAEEGRAGRVYFVGEIKNTPSAMMRLIKKLSKQYESLQMCYEAGPCGYTLYRLLAKQDIACMVVAPSLIPDKLGDRIKTDRRDAISLARLHRAGELTAVWVPDEAHEAMRDLVRARTAAMERSRSLKQQLLGFMLRHGYVYRDGRNWTKKHRRWLSAQRFIYPAQQIVFEEYLQAVDYACEQEQRLIDQIRELLPQWSLAPLVEALQSMRGVAFIVAVTFVAEAGDIRRFDSPRQLMAYLGLVPAEYSSAGRIIRGGITATGNKEARRVLIEGAWTYTHNAYVNPIKREVIDTQPKSIRDIAWKAQIRLSHKYRKMREKGKHANLINTAIAREMTGFIWDIAHHIERPGTA